jgi:hypothetical protein
MPVVWARRLVLAVTAILVAACAAFALWHQ